MRTRSQQAAALSTPAKRGASQPVVSPPPASKQRKITGATTFLAEARKVDNGMAMAIVPAATMLERASVALRPGEHKGQLPCREDEWQEVSTYLHRALLAGGTSQALYISGMPGTGKTALVLEVIQQLGKERVVPEFMQIHVNAMRLGSPYAIFGTILQQIGLRSQGSNVSPGTARAELGAFFAHRLAKAAPIVLIIDEVDHLVTPNQALLYHIFDWLGLPRPGLVMVAISNTMDLPERLLPRVASRFGIVRIDFMPYNRDQLVKILKERLRSHGATGALSEDAVRLAAARVAAGSGDLRKALQLSRQAVEVCSARTKGQGVVSLTDLQHAEKVLLHANPVAQGIAGLGVKPRRLLAALLVELRKRDVETVPLRKVCSRYAKLCMDPEPKPHVQIERIEEANHLLKRLFAMSLVTMRHGTVKDDAALLTLGSGLDDEDLSKALLRVEEDQGLRRILEGEQVLSSGCFPDEA